MEAVKFVKEWARMCDSQTSCDFCTINKNLSQHNLCGGKVKNNPEKSVAIIEKWSAEHPIKTRQSEFLKMFPDASIGVNGVLVIAPCNVNTKFESEICAIGKCEDCKKEYWLAEVD